MGSFSKGGDHVYNGATWWLIVLRHCPTFDANNLLRWIWNQDNHTIPHLFVFFVYGFYMSSRQFKFNKGHWIWVQYPLHGKLFIKSLDEVVTNVYSNMWYPIKCIIINSNCVCLGLRAYRQVQLMNYVDGLWVEIGRRRVLGEWHILKSHGCMGGIPLVCRTLYCGGQP